MKYTKAVVTGGAGFIGSHLVDALIRRHIKVFVVDDLTAGDKKRLNPNARFHKLSILSPALPKLLKTIKPDVIFHLAAQTSVQQSLKDPVGDARVNILGTLLLARAAAAAKVPKIVFSSTGGALYTGRPPFSETDTIAPASPYGLSKAGAEEYLAFAKRQYGLKTTILRYANVYGPGQTPNGESGVIAIFGKALLAGKSLTINGDGKQTRDFVYVDDVVRANLLAMMKDGEGTFNIGTGKETSMNTIFRLMTKIVGANVKEKHGPAKDGEVLRSALNVAKAKKELGWESSVSLEEGLAKTIKWMQKKM